MVNETTSKSANFGSKSRKERVDLARSRDILDVAEQLGMELERAGRDYRWKEHDSLVITPNKNVWKWFSRDQGGDVIALVETIKEINFNQAIDYLNDGVFKTFDSSGRQEKQEPFRYLMEKYEHPDFETARNYLKNERGLSDETINFFLASGKMAEATRKKGDYFEPVIVFKYKDLDGKLVGASLQGIVENRVQHPERGRLKQIIQNSDSMQGFSVDVGNPKRLVFAESSIDLMSYYQANKDHLNDVRLVAMDGLKESTVGFHLAQLQSELSGRPLNWSREQLADGVNIAAQNGFFKDGKRSDMITLAVDNDTAGHNFITNFLKKEIPIQIDIPPILYRNRDKADWNDYLTRPTTSGTALYHVYSFDRENEDYHYHGYYPEELAVFKQKELTSDKVKVVTSKGILMKEEIEPLIAFTEGLLQDRASQKEIEKLTPPHLQVEFDFSENRKISETFSSGERISYKDFVNVLYEENDWAIISSLKKGYDKTYFALLDEKGNRLTDNLRFDIGNERNTIAEDLKDYNLPAAYLELAQEADRSYANQISYGSLTGNIKTLTESVQNKIQRGQLSIHLSDEVYFYTLVNYTGWSYPMQQLRPEALDALKEHRSFFESINETNIERFKEKGTPEQNQMYQLLKGIQKELGRSDTSTIFSEEVAISAYNLNKRLDSLTAENWGKSISEPLNSLGRDTWNILSYPANQIDTPNNDYFYQLVPYHLLEYLEHSTGQTEISVDVYEQILDKLKYRSVEVIPPEEDIKKTQNEDSLQNITQEKDQKDNSRLAQAQRKLNRLKGELDNSIQVAQEHQNLTNGQPMNDKRNGATFFKKQEQLENKVFSTMDEIKKQEERIERLQEREDRKAAGLNRQGNGLDMSVQNLPKIREEIEKADRGESMFTKETIKRYRQELERLEAAQNKAEGVIIQPAAQSLIDEGIVNQWQKRPDTYFVKGLRRVALELTEEGNFQISSNWKYQPKTEDEKEKVEDLLNRQSLQQEHIIKEHVEVKPQLQVAFDFSENQVLSNKYHEGDIVLYQEFVKDFYPEMIRRRTESVALQNGYDKTYFALLDENNNELVKDIRFDLGDPTTRLSEECENYLPPKYLTIAKEIDQNYFGDQSSIQKVTENIKKAPEQAQEQMNDRTSGGTGSLQPKAEGSTSPVLETSTFERSVTSRPTSSYPYLHFTTNYAEVQKRIGNYHPITPVDLKRLNQYAPSIQSTARWYLDELADSKISFIYADRGIENILEVTFQKENFIHLSGIRPFEEGKGAADFLEDFASGYGSYDGVLISNAIKDKLQVLPMLQDILEPQSFVLDDLTSVEKLHNLNMSEAIKSKDEDFLLLFKDAGDEKIPASLMKLKGELATNVQDLAEKTILGIYRERNGQIEQLAINDDYVKDNGEEMLSVLKNRQYEEILERIEPQNEQLSQPENQSLNQELGKDLDRPLNVLESVSEDAEMGQEVSTISPKQELKDGLARRVEEITKQNQKEALVASIPELQEKLSRESDLMGSSLTDRGMLYTHQESFGKDYQLELAIHSSTAVESLTEQPAPWSLAVLKDNQILGYLAYGSDWGNDFQIEDNLEGLVEQILSEEVSKGLYSQEEIDTFLKEIQVGETQQNKPVEEFSSDVPFDYAKASAYELSEIAFQKVREFTQSPEELAHYMDFMSKFPTLSHRNAALVQAQWPGANAVATFNQWKALGETLGISSDDVVQTTNTFTNKRTGNSQEVTKQTLSVKAGEHAQITLFRPVMEEMIPVFDENGKQVINGKGHPKFKKKKEASLEEKQLIAEGKLKVVQFQVRDLETGQGKFTLYKVFELSQTNLKPEAYPKAMPNRHYNFETDKVKTKEVLLGLQDYAQKLGVAISTDEHHVLGNAKGAFYPNDQKILLNPDNSIGEKIGTTIHELAHATLHNFHEGKKEVSLSSGRKELEAEMTSYLVSKHFGLDTSEKAIRYMSHWTNQLKDLNDKELNQFMTRIHKTVSCVIKSVEKHTKPYQMNRNRGQNFGSRFPNKSLKM
ncbi:PBECR4 domain-containing protein [Streptococcus anginosus]|uniref:PBECR4 domain-containing protein n=1 Tax=Streptococcus anginosus TaxID=1328 RepID=UPI0021F8D9FC|nr:PBECR4 domain-containing protein [Streptococcus anginosus]MCW1056644.1 PBECR4 domain-containing protein [Streptococcus anginosus]